MTCRGAGAPTYVCAIPVVTIQRFDERTRFDSQLLPARPSRAGSNLTAAFSEDARYLFYGVGVKVSKGNRKLQFFAHALLGAAHIFPRAATGNNGFAVRLGGGVETRLQQRRWLRIEADYVRSQLYSSGQNSFQVVAAIVYRF